MKPGESIRFACGDCQVVFDICVAATSEWAEALDLEADADNEFEPTCCPFCHARLHASFCRMRRAATLVDGPV